MNPKAQRTILRQSRIFGYSAAVLTIPFAFLGGLIASCCPFGVLIGAIPLLITSSFGAQLAAIFLDYSVVSRRNSTGAGLRVGVRTATISALVGGVFTLFTASQSLSAMTAAAGAGDPQGGGVAAAITLGLMNLLMLLVVVACCAVLSIVPGVIGAALRGSAAQDSEPEPEPGWDAELKSLKKSSLIEWAILIVLLAASALIIPSIQQYSMGKSSTQEQRMTDYESTDHFDEPPTPDAPRAFQPTDREPFSVSPDGKYTVEIVEDSQQGRLIVVKERGDHLFEEPAMGYLLEVHWSPAGRFVAINERRGNSGDYLWILDLQRQTVLKRPDDTIWRAIVSKCVPVLEARASEKWGKSVRGDRDWGAAHRWEDENTLMATVAVSFRGSMIAVGADSKLEAEVRLSVKPEGVSLIKETPTVSRTIGSELLYSGFGIEFIEESETLVSTFEWYARFGAERVKIRINDLDLESARVEQRNERGVFEGGVPVVVPLKPGLSLKKERWASGPSDFSWSRPPDQIVDANAGLTTLALDAEKAAALISALRTLKANSRESDPRTPEPLTTARPNPPTSLSAYDGKVGRLAARFELEWHSDRTVSGRYWHPSRDPGTKYELKGENPKEGELLLNEFTKGALTARIHLFKDASVNGVTWKGRMHNTDGRKFDVIMTRSMAIQPVRPARAGRIQQIPEIQLFSKTLALLWAGGAIEENALGGLSPWELKVLRNAIFARHGRTFESGMLSGFFHRYPGYKADPGYDDGRITTVDRTNAETIKAAETRASRPSPDTAWNALRCFLDALAAGDAEFIASLVHPSTPVKRVMFTLQDPPQVAHMEKLSGNSKELKDLWLDDGANGEGYCFMMSALWDLTLSAQHAGGGMFRNKGSFMEVEFTEISGKWWLTRVADVAP